MAERFTLEQIAGALAGLPSPAFRARLKAELERKTGMTVESVPDVAAVKPGFRSLAPYLIAPRDPGAAALIDFLKQAFDAREAFRVPRPDGSIMHAQLDVAGSVIELADAGGPWQARPSALHFYVPDADTVYQRAIFAGASSLAAPVDQPYGDREAAVRDPAGNNWYIGTHRGGGSFLHEGLVENVTIYLHPKGAGSLIDFLKQAFDAREIGVFRSPGDVVRHAKLAIGSSVIEMSEAHGEWQPMPTGIHYYVADCDAVYRTAIEAGAEAISPVADQPYGERSGTVRDPAGNWWFIATYTGRVQSS